MNPLARKHVETASARWVVLHDRAYDYLPAVAQTLRREGLALSLHQVSGAPCLWAREVAEQVAAGQQIGAVVFASVPCIVACVANKVPGIRAVMVSTVPQLSLALLELNPNVVVVEMPGRTFFEMKQFARCFHDPAQPLVPVLAQTLKELDHHAHR
jgi:hypothetical protein